MMLDDLKLYFMRGVVKYESFVRLRYGMEESH